MNIVIVGAGDIGLYAAALFSKAGHNITLIDHLADHIDRSTQDLDVASLEGSATDWQLLQELTETPQDALFAFTGDDETNLVCSAMAKSLGYKQTIARIKNRLYINQTSIDFKQVFSVDHLISPDLLAAGDLLKFVEAGEALFLQHFAHGSVQMNTFKLPSSWKFEQKPIFELGLPPQIIIGLIRREDPSSKESKSQIIFPHGADRLFPGDELTVIGERGALEAAYTFFGISKEPIGSAFIVGGTQVGRHIASCLAERGTHVRLCDHDPEVCKLLAKRLPKVSVLNKNAMDPAFLEAERIDDCDVFLATTNHDEMNLSCGIIAKDLGCPKVGLILADTRLNDMAKSRGIDICVSPRISATSRLLSIASSEKIASMVSLYDHRAEIMEIEVSSSSPLVGIPIAELSPKLPQDFLIAVIQNRGRIMIGGGNRILTPGDTVIVISNPDHLDSLRTLF